MVDLRARSSRGLKGPQRQTWQGNRSLDNKALKALQEHDRALPEIVVEAGIAAYKRALEENIAPPWVQSQTRALVVRIYRAMRLAGG